MLISKKSKNIENGTCIPVKRIDFTLFERGREIANSLAMIGCDTKAGYRGRGSIVSTKCPEVKTDFGDKLDLFLWGEFNSFQVFRIDQEGDTNFGIGFEDQSVDYEQYEILLFENIRNACKVSDEERIINYRSDFGNRQYRITENDYNVLISELEKIQGRFWRNK